MVEIMKRGTRGRIARPKTWQAGLELCLVGTVRGVDYMPGRKRQTISDGGRKGTEVVGTRAEAFASEHPDDAIDCLNRVTMDLAREEDFEGALHWQALADSLGEWLSTDYAERDPWEPEAEPEPKKKHPGGPRKGRRLVRNAEEVTAFLNAVNRRSGTGKRTYALALFLFASGGRITEVLNLTRADLDLEFGEATFRVTKSGNPRKVQLVLVDKVREAIEDWYTVREAWNPKSDLVFVSRPGNNPRVGKDSEIVDYTSILRAFATVSKRAGIESISPHMLRHTHATLTLKSGGSLTGLAEKLGHASPDTTAKYYLHVISDEQKQAAKAFDKGWNL